MPGEASLSDRAFNFTIIVSTNNANIRIGEAETIYTNIQGIQITIMAIMRGGPKPINPGATTGATQTIRPKANTSIRHAFSESLITRVTVIKLHKSGNPKITIRNTATISIDSYRQG